MFYVHPADRTTGHCPHGSQRVHRAFDNRADVNHWYGILPVKPSGWSVYGTVRARPRFTDRSFMPSS